MSEDQTQVIDPVAAGKDGDPVSTPANTTTEGDATAITNVFNQAPEIFKESKAGYRTTEFWVTIAISLLTVLNGIPLPDKYEGFVVAALGAVYALSRGIAKHGQPSIEPDPAAIAPVDEIVQRETGEKIV